MEIEKEKILTHKQIIQKAYYQKNKLKIINYAKNYHQQSIYLRYLGVLPAKI